MTKRATAGVRALLLLAVLTVAVPALTRSSGSGSTSPDGPMRPSVEHGMVPEGQVGTRFTDGFEVLQLTGDRSATILKVESVGGSDTFRQLGALIAGPERKWSATNYIRRFPPTGRALGELVPAEGAVIRPREDTRAGMAYELLVGYEIVDDSKVGYRAGLEVTYRVGEDVFVWRSPARLLYCPEPMESEACRETAEADEWGD